MIDGRCSAACMLTATTSMTLDIAAIGSTPMARCDALGAHARALDGHAPFARGEAVDARRAPLRASASAATAATAPRATARRARIANAKALVTTPPTRACVNSPEGVLAALVCVGTCAGVLEKRTRVGARVSGPVLAMASASALASANALPGASAAYEAVWTTVMPSGVVLALLASGKALVGKGWTGAGEDVAKAFVVGACGTVVGTAAAFAACGRALGTHGAKIAGCLCASYIGGSLNFAATAQALDVVNAGGKALLTGAMAADNLAMCAYLAALFAIKTSGPSEEERSREVESGERVLSGVTAASACASLAMALIVLELSRLVAAGFGAPSLSLGVACVLAPIVSISASTIARTSKSESRNLSSILAFSGSQPMSEALMLLFFATLGAMVDLRTIFATLSGGAMLPFIAILLTTQLVFTLLVGHKLLKIPLWAVLVAANANVGGPATAAAMAAARGWRQAFAPAVATGIFGYSIATLIGVAIGNFLA